eukprot:jgi/Psemu1/58446/gm1.58446_g
MGQATPETITNQTGPYKVPGDMINAFVLVSSLAYVWGVVYFTQPGVKGVLDEHWKKDGFCIQNKDVPFWSSFDTCLYFDVIFSLVLGIMYLAWKEIPGMETSSLLVPSMIAGTLGHGIAHGYMATKLRVETEDQNADEDDITPNTPLWHLVMFCVGFWFPLLKAAMAKMSNQRLLIFAALATYGTTLVKKEVKFGYIQTIINVAFSVSQLMLPPEKKNEREYMTLPLAGALTVVVAWNEALFCDAYFRSLGGHTLYDISIILSFIVFYADSFRFHTKSNISSSTKEKTM